MKVTPSSASPCLRIQFILSLVCLVLTNLLAHPLQAQTAPPWQIADASRKALFDAQTALLDNDVETAKRQLALAQTSLEAFADQVKLFDPALAQDIRARATQLTAFKSSPDLAARRAYVWALVLQGSYTATLQAIDNNQMEAAQQWFQIRVFRKSTRVTLASANGTKALADWRSGTLTRADARLAVQSDLQDTYTAQLRDALSAVDKAVEKKIPESAAENATLAQGYFGMVRQVYLAQRGMTQTRQLADTLAQLTLDSVAGHWAEVSKSVAVVRSGLDGFSPMALSAKDIATKGAQLIQFLNLIQIEYEKGVSNGQVKVVLEYEEARTFHEQSGVLVGEIKSTLIEKNSAAFDQLSTNLNNIGALLTRVAAPAEVSQLTQNSITLLTDTFGFQATGGDIPTTLALLKQMQQRTNAADWQQAELIRLQAYAIFEVGTEKKLLTHEPALGDQLQSLFWEGTPDAQGLAVLIKDKANKGEFNTTLTLMNTRFDDAQTLLATTMTPIGAMAGSAAILIREGLEAVLVIAAVMGYLRATQAPARAQVQVLSGAGLGIVLGVVMWLLAQTVLAITPVNRELFEGVIALLAAAVLFYVTNWLLHKVYVADWMAFIKSQVQKAMGEGAALGLAVLGFMVVFREGFETVLFFQALLFDAPAWAVGVGAAIGALVIGAVAYLMLRYSVKIPLKPFFTWTGFLLLILAIGFVGNGIRNLQEAGWVSVSRLDLIPVGFIPSLFGLFPTLQTTAAQLAIVLALGVTFVVSKTRARSAQRPEQKTKVA